MQTILDEEGHPLELFRTYMAMVEGSVGSGQYRRLFVRKPDGPVDVIGEGDLACAYFVSSILTLCGLIRNGVHTTVVETVRDMERSGWRKTKDLRRGSILVWEPRLCMDHTFHRHIGFLVDTDEAISNVSDEKSPGRHHATYGERRTIEAVYWHQKLGPAS